MIKNIYSSSNHIQINPGYHNVPPISPGALSGGMMRWNSNSNTVEVYNGISWFTIDTTATILLSDSAQRALDWAVKKMQEEDRLKSLMDRHPGLKDLHDKYEIMKVLCQEEEKQQ